MSSDRTASFWQQAEYATARADKARSDELRRAWLIVARDWANMARSEEEKILLQKLAYVADAVPMAPRTSHDEPALSFEQSEDAIEPAQA